MGSPSSCPHAVAGALDPWSGTLDHYFGEVQHDLLLSVLTIGEAYCLLEVLQGIPHTRWRRQGVVRQHGEEIARRCPHCGERLGTDPPRQPPPAHRRGRI